MTTTQSQPRFWAFTVSSIRESVYLYFHPFYSLSVWLLQKRKARIVRRESWVKLARRDVLDIYQKSTAWQSVALIVSALPYKEAAQAIKSISQPLVDDMQGDVLEKKHFIAIVAELEARGE